jgi:hypothetical protein
MQIRKKKPLCFLTHEGRTKAEIREIRRRGWKGAREECEKREKKKVAAATAARTQKAIKISNAAKETLPHGVLMHSHSVHHKGGTPGVK